MAIFTHDLSGTEIVHKKVNKTSLLYTYPPEDFALKVHKTLSYLFEKRNS